MNQTPEQLVATWMSHINRREMEKLLALYDEKAVLIPTFSNRLLNTPAKVRKYFQDLVARDELSIALHQNTVNIHALAGGIHAVCGIYCWRFAVEGEVLSFEARFSFVVDMDRERPILQHHSSQIPRSL